MLPNAIAIGIRNDEFWNMTMRIFQAHIDAHKLKQEMADRDMWQMGMYVQSAVTVAVEHCLSGNKAKSKYLEKPLLEEYKRQHRELTEDEIIIERKNFALKLLEMEKNFKAHHGDGNK